MVSAYLMWCSVYIPLFSMLEIHHYLVYTCITFLKITIVILKTYSVINTYNIKRIVCTMHKVQFWLRDNMRIWKWCAINSQWQFSDRETRNFKRWTLFKVPIRYNVHCTDKWEISWYLILSRYWIRNRYTERLHNWALLNSR